MTFSLRKLVATAAVVCTIGALTGVASADNVQNDVEATAETLTIASGGSATVTYRIVGNNAPQGDVEGCNVDSSSPATLTISVPTGVSVNDNTLQFDKCKDGDQSAVFTSSTPNAAGYTITHSMTGGKTGSIWANHANWILKVTGTSVQPPADPCAGRTAPAGAPTVTSTNSPDATSGWYNASSSAAKFTVSPSTSAEYRINGGTWTAYTGEVTLSTDGQHSVTARNFLPATTDPVCARLDGPESAATLFKIDRTAPTATPGDVVADSTWRTSRSQEFTFADPAGGSGLAPTQGLTADDKATVTVDTESASATLPSAASKTVYDVAGNSVTRSVSSLIDRTDPTNVQFVGGPAAGASYYWGSVPAAPTCTADDALSGIPVGGCVVTGHSQAVGGWTLTATATDRAGNDTVVTRFYTVLAWDLKGFYSPVDMGGVVNTVKAGATVPLKFEVFAAQELTSTSIISTFTKKVTCPNTGGEDAVEDFSTGSTSLRYDNTAGQFVFNMQMPKEVGSCHQVKMTTPDGSSLTAFFKLK